MERLALAKLEKQRAKLAKEGLGWVEIIPRADHAALSEFGRVRVVPGELGERQKTWAALLDERLESLAGRMARRFAAAPIPGWAGHGEVMGCRC